MERFYIDNKAGEINNPNGKWGAFLPLPNGARASINSSVEGTASVWNVYRNSSDEIVIRYSFYIGKNEFWCDYNFPQNKLEYECQVNDEKNGQCPRDNIAAGLNRISSISSLMKKSVGEGFSLAPYSDGMEALKSGGYEITSPEGDVRYEKILWISPEKHEFWVNTDLAGFDAKEINHIHVEAPYMVYYELDEKTLLGHAVQFPIVIVFRNDMTSPYFYNNQPLIQIDGKRVDSVYKDCFSEKLVNEDAIENADKCLVEFLKGEYSWLNHQ